MDDLEKMFGNGEGKPKKSENETSAKEKRKESWENFKKLYDWAKLPFELIVVVILIFSAYLMQQSIYEMTKNYFLSILAPSFTEGAFVAAHLATDRTRNSIKQKEIASFLQWWQVGITVILLILNLIVETTKEVVSSLGFLTDENIRFAIFFFIGVDFLALIISYIKYQNADEIIKIKRDNAKDLQDIETRTLKSRMTALADAEQIKADEKIRVWRELAPDVARSQARIEAAGEIRDIYTKTNLSPEEAKKLLGSFGMVEGEVVEEENQKLSKRPYLKTGKYKRLALPEKIEEESSKSFTQQGETKKEEKDLDLKNANFE